MANARQTTAKPACPGCGHRWLRATSLPGRYRCVYCLRRYELRSDCPTCGAHSTIARMADTSDMVCRNCGETTLRPV
ncbi:MAG TPA: zinc-ribbon domain-containing protein [Thermoleophilaceae bacterium]|nr:zinc-ribbon domain-containing protein [Thermoleophilaceae bacterium]